MTASRSAESGQEADSPAEETPGPAPAAGGTAGGTDTGAERPPGRAAPAAPAGQDAAGQNAATPAPVSARSHAAGPRHAAGHRHAAARGARKSNERTPGPALPGGPGPADQEQETAAADPAAADPAAADPPAADHAAADHAAADHAAAVPGPDAEAGQDTASPEETTSPDLVAIPDAAGPAPGMATPGPGAPGQDPPPQAAPAPQAGPGTVPASDAPAEPAAMIPGPAMPGWPQAQDGAPQAAPGDAGTGGDPGEPPRPALPDRLNAIATLVQIGSQRTEQGFGRKLLATAQDLLARAGQRLRLSSEHTVVVLAGGTGSGKSSLFNALAGADFSTVGVTRPVTKDAHACVWGIRGSGPLLEWLGVPRRHRYARSSALDRGERSLTGLVLLDLPDHDTVMTHASGVVDGLVEMADLMVWVLDPQKYADAAVHRRFLVPLAGHSEVVSVVLNQADLLDPQQVEDCTGDLRRLLDAEELHDTQILVTSAFSGAGLDDLRGLLADAVSARRAASARISADVDALAARFAPYAGSPQTPAAVPAASVEQLAAAFSAAAGVPAVGDALRSARELRAVDYVGWPVAWLAERLAGRDPIRKVRLGRLWDELRSVTAGPAGAQQAEVDNAITRLADEVSQPLPEPWSQTVRDAARSRAGNIPAALGTGMGDALPAENTVAGWWRLAGAWQGLLLGSAIVGAAWMAAIVVLGVFHADRTAPRMFTDVALLAWIGGIVAAVLLLGWLTARISLNLVRAEAERESAAFGTAMRQQITRVAAEQVVAPVEAELAEFTRFRDQLKIAAADPS